MKKVLFIMIIVLMLFLNGCSSKTNQYCVAYEGKGSLGYDEINNTYLIKECIKSKQELMELCDRYSNGFYDINSKNYNNQIPTIIRGYDDTYFNKKDLIILVVDKGNSFDYQICGIDIRDTYIDIIIKKLHKYGGFTDEAYAYLFLIEIEKQEQEEIILSIRDK